MSSLEQNKEENHCPPPSSTLFYMSAVHPLILCTLELALYRTGGPGGFHGAIVP